jgi:hypothetical protein
LIPNGWRGLLAAVLSQLAAWQAAARSPGHERHTDSPPSEPLWSLIDLADCNDPTRHTRRASVSYSREPMTINDLHDRDWFAASEQDLAWIV